MSSVGTFALGTGGLRHVIITIPGPGNDWSYAVPSRTRLRPICGRATLTTSAVVATRRPQLYPVIGGMLIFRSTNYGSHSASTAQPYSIKQGSEQTNAIIGYDISLYFPPGLVLPAAAHFRVLTTALDAGDTWSNVSLLVEEWIEA